MAKDDANLVKPADFDDKHGLWDVSLRGEASVERNPAQAKALWSTMAGAWFPGGPDDPALGVMHIDHRRFTS